jgi:hypothetical protein
VLKSSSLCLYREIPTKIFLSETICSIRTKFWRNSHWMVLFEICVRRFGPSIKMALFWAWRPSWLEVGITGHNFGRGPSKVHSTKVWLQLAQWFLRRRFLCEFPIGSYVKLSSAVGAILVKGPKPPDIFLEENHPDEFKRKSSPLKLLSQSQPNFAEMILGWAPSKIVSGISDLRPRWPPQPNLI